MIRRKPDQTLTSLAEISLRSLWSFRRHSQLLVGNMSAISIRYEHIRLWDTGWFAYLEEGETLIQRVTFVSMA